MIQKRSREGVEESSPPSKDRSQEGTESQEDESTIEAENEEGVSEHQSEEISADEVKKGRWKLQYIPPDE